MSDQFSENKNLVKNQLFSAAVTGGTLEDYSQNVILLPAPSLPSVSHTGNVLTGSPINLTAPHTETDHFAHQLTTPFTNTANVVSSPISANSTNTLSWPNTATSHPISLDSVSFFEVTGQSTGVPSQSTSPNVGCQFPPYQPLHPSALTNLSSSEHLLYTPVINSSTNSDLSNTAAGNYASLDSVPLFDMPANNTGLTSPNIEQTFHTKEHSIGQSSLKQLPTTAILNQIQFNELSSTNLISPSITTETGNYATLSSISEFNTGGQTSGGYSLAPHSSTNTVSETKETPKNLYRRSGINKLSYAQVPGLVSSTRLETSHMLNPVSVPNLNSYAVPSVTPPSNASSNNYNIQALPPVKLPTPTPFQVSEDTKNNSKQATGFNPAALYTFNLNSSDQGGISVPPTVFNPSVFSTQSASAAPSSILSPVTISAEENSESPEMLLLEAYSNKNEALSNKPGFTPQKCRPVYHHWFFRKEIESRVNWQPFSMVDSLALEEAFFSSSLNPGTVVGTDGGRFDVNLLRRERYSIYWNSAPTEVRRCSWFYKGHNDGRFTPFEESVATLLEEKYTNAFQTNTWNHKVELSNGESLLMVGPDALFLFPTQQIPDPWDNEKSQVRPKIVKRGMDEFDIDEGESEKIDHLLFLVHGIGSVCDLKFRSVELVVDEFRNIASQLLNSHYQTSFNNGIVHRIEVLPISWHNKLHSDDTGIDTKLKHITLSSIPRLRDFTNDTLLDILLYTSPLYCQTIITSVGSELNRVYEMFKSRNPSFEGGVSLGGHSLGSLILFDLLCHQKDIQSLPKQNAPQEVKVSSDVKIVPQNQQNQQVSRRISSLLCEIGSSQLQLIFPQLSFEPTALFALGSPIGMFLTIRGLDKLGDEFSFPTCPGFFNIFHPYDPVAYRIEPLINQELAKLKPVLIPHHKGRKRMHLELKDTVSRVGADLKHKLLDSVKTTWNTLFQMGLFARQENDQPNLENEVQSESITNQRIVEVHCQNVEDESTGMHLGMFNNGRRIDYVLQEAPFEIFNEYIFALTSHVCYWESEDTILLILKEIYNSMGVSPDSQQLATQATTDMQLSKTLSDDQTLPNNNQSHQYLIGTPNQLVQIGMDPTMPITSNTNIGPPPTSGFFRASSSSS